MKHNKLLLFMVVVCSFMIACENEKGKTKIETVTESYIIENIEFEANTNSIDGFLAGSKSNDKIVISTDSETVVMYLNYVTFYKTDNAESTVDVLKKIKGDDMMRFKDDETAEIHLNENDVKVFSKKYASLYLQTLDFKVAN